MEDLSRSDPLIWYREAVMYGMDSWTVPGIREQRDTVTRLFLDRHQQQKLENLDSRLMSAVIDPNDDEVPSELLQDDSDHALYQWWWHLGKLRTGTYPADLLPPHLQAVYQPADRQAA